jgi:hypothetical protein
LKVLTGDYAMQNVALQMGLNVLGSGGKRVREVRTWVFLAQPGVEERVSDQRWRHLLSRQNGGVELT